MSEQKRPEKLTAPSWRAIIMLGTIGTYEEVDERRVTSLPTRAVVEALIGTGETLQVVRRKDTGAYLVDWTLIRPDQDTALEYSATHTNALKDSAGLAGVEIKTIRIAEYTCLTQAQDPNAVWGAMPASPGPDDLEAIRSLRIEDFM